MADMLPTVVANIDRLERDLGSVDEPVPEASRRWAEAMKAGKVLFYGHQEVQVGHRDVIPAGACLPERLPTGDPIPGLHGGSILEMRVQMVERFFRRHLQEGSQAGRQLVLACFQQHHIAIRQALCHRHYDTARQDGLDDLPADRGAIPLVVVSKIHPLVAIVLAHGRGVVRAGNDGNQLFKIVLCQGRAKPGDYGDVWGLAGLQGWTGWDLGRHRAGSLDWLRRAGVRWNGRICGRG